MSLTSFSISEKSPIIRLTMNEQVSQTCLIKAYFFDKSRNCFENSSLQSKLSSMSLFYFWGNVRRKLSEIEVRGNFDFREWGVIIRYAVDDEQYDRTFPLLFVILSFSWSLACAGFPITEGQSSIKRRGGDSACRKGSEGENENILSSLNSEWSRGPST